MPIISVYNNKGGEGKSTVTVGLAEFLAGNRNKQVLVIDLDSQGSSSCSLLGHQAIKEASARRQTVPDLFTRLRQTRKPIADLEEFLIRRPAAEARGSALSEIAVLLPDKPRQVEIEEQMNWRTDSKMFLSWLKPALSVFDYVLIDLPGNLIRTSVIPVNGMVMSDHVLIPVKPTRISLDALPDTFETIDFIQTLTGTGSPSVLGFLLNATDKRFQQYRAVFPPILEEITNGNLPAVFQNAWPPSPALETATDETRECSTLKERFGKCYEHVRKVTLELDRLCSGEAPELQEPVRRTIWQKLGLA